MKYTFCIRMSGLHAMPITKITHSACYTVEMGVSARDLTRITFDNNHTAYKHICLQGIGCVCVKNYPSEIMQPLASTRATIGSAENQNGATIVKATFFFCYYYIVWESNNAGEARGQSWNESLKSRWIPGGSCGYTSGTKRKHFAVVMLTMVAAATIVRFPPVRCDYANQPITKRLMGSRPYWHEFLYCDTVWKSFVSPVVVAVSTLWLNQLCGCWKLARQFGKQFTTILFTKSFDCLSAGEIKLNPGKRTT